MMKNLQNLREKYSTIQREQDSLTIRGTYYTYSPLGLNKRKGEVLIPINRITNTGVIKYKDSKARNVMLLTGVVTLLYDKIFGKWFVELLNVPTLDILETTLYIIWMITLIRYLTKTKKLLEVTTKEIRYGIPKNGMNLNKLNELIQS